MFSSMLMSAAHHLTNALLINTKNIAIFLRLLRLLLELIYLMANDNCIGMLRNNDLDVCKEPHSRSVATAWTNGTLKKSN